MIRPVCVHILYYSICLQTTFNIAIHCLNPSEKIHIYDLNEILSDHLFSKILEFIFVLKLLDNDGMFILLVLFIWTFIIICIYKQMNTQLFKSIDQLLISSKKPEHEIVQYSLGLCCKL